MRGRLDIGRDFDGGLGLGEGLGFAHGTISGVGTWRVLPPALARRRTCLGVLLGPGSRSGSGPGGGFNARSRGLLTKMRKPIRLTQRSGVTLTSKPAARKSDNSR